MAELVDAADSKSVFERSGSSSLPRGTILKKTLKFKVFFFVFRKVGGQLIPHSPPITTWNTVQCGSWLACDYASPNTLKPPAYTPTESPSSVTPFGNIPFAKSSTTAFPISPK